MLKQYLHHKHSSAQPILVGQALLVQNSLKTVWLGGALLV